MEFFFNDPNIERLPPEKTRLLDLRADPNPDGKRIRVALELTPFLKRPYIELILADPAGREITSASIVEPNGWKLELTLHLRRGPVPEPGVEAAVNTEEKTATPAECSLTATLSYPDLGEIDRRQITVAC